MIKRDGESEFVGTQLLLLQKVYDLEAALRLSNERCQELEKEILEHHRNFTPPTTFLPKTVSSTMTNEIAILNDYALLYRHQKLKSIASGSKHLRSLLAGRENEKEVEMLRKRVAELSSVVHRLQGIEFGGSD